MNFWGKIKAAARELTPNCREAVRAQSDALERPPTLTTRLGMRLHLLMCKWCRRYGQQIRFLRTAAHEHSDEFTAAAPKKLSHEARARMKQKLQSERKL
jgi:hypothetical protein